MTNTDISQSIFALNRAEVRSAQRSDATHWGGRWDSKWRSTTLKEIEIRTAWASQCVAVIESATS